MVKTNTIILETCRQITIETCDLPLPAGNRYLYAQGRTFVLPTSAKLRHGMSMA